MTSINKAQTTNLPTVTERAGGTLVNVGLTYAQAEVHTPSVVANLVGSLGTVAVAAHAQLLEDLFVAGAGPTPTPADAWVIGRLAAVKNGMVQKAVRLFDNGMNQFDAVVKPAQAAIHAAAGDPLPLQTVPETLDGISNVVQSLPFPTTEKLPHGVQTAQNHIGHSVNRALDAAGNLGLGVAEATFVTTPTLAAQLPVFGLESAVGSASLLLSKGFGHFPETFPTFTKAFNVLGVRSLAAAGDTYGNMIRSVGSVAASVVVAGEHANQAVQHGRTALKCVDVG